MRSLHAVALVCILALTVTAILTVPSCINHVFDPPSDWVRQREEMRVSARQTVTRLRKRHGGRPVEEWPEKDRQIWRNARRILGED